MQLSLLLLMLPFFFVYSPALLMQGEPLKIVEATFTAIIGTIALAGALQGYMFGYTRLWQRAFMGVGGVLLIFPDWRAEIAGFLLAGGSVLWHWRETRAAGLQRPLVERPAGPATP